MPRAWAVRAVVKAQVHAGGRGKAGGIKVVSSPDEAAEAAAAMLGTRLVTFQTGPEGVPVDAVLVEELLDIDRELYVGIVTDGAARGPVVMVSEAGGMDIEEVAETTPDRIMRIAVDPGLGLQPYQGRKIAYGLGMGPAQVRPVASMMQSLYRIFRESDCSLVEINPLAVTSDGRVLAADAKIDFDDDALFRHSDLDDLHDPAQDDPLEAQAAEYGISYVKLDGGVGCMVNGAGLAMATMDVIGQTGAGPANFPGRWRRSRRGEGRPGPPYHPLRSRREGRAHKHLRRHTPLRRCCQGYAPGSRREPADGPSNGRPHAGHQRGGGARDTVGVRPGGQARRRPGRGRARRRRGPGRCGLTPGPLAGP